jgi:hypothetical protein
MLPNGGTGTVNGSAIMFVTFDNGTGNCTFTGTRTADQQSTSGVWNCPALPVGGSASGTRQAVLSESEGEAPAEGEGDGLLTAIASYLAKLDDRNMKATEEPSRSWEDAIDAMFGNNG